MFQTTNQNSGILGQKTFFDWPISYQKLCSVNPPIIPSIWQWNSLYNCIWLVVFRHPSEKSWSSSVGMMKFPISGKSWHSWSKPWTSVFFYVIMFLASQNCHTAIPGRFLNVLDAILVHLLCCSGWSFKKNTTDWSNGILIPMGKKIHVPNHQPAMVYRWYIYSIHGGYKFIVQFIVNGC